MTPTLQPPLPLVEQDPTALTLTQELTITNNSWTAALVTGATSPIPELTVTDVDGAPIRIDSGHTATVVVHYRITDCSQLLPAPSVSYGQVEQPRLVVDHWWGSVSVPVAELPRDTAANLCEN